MTINSLTLSLALLITVSCGKQVNVSTKDLKYNSSLSDGKNVPDKDGVITRGTPDKISANGSDYTVSIYSSYQALEFIAAKPLNTQIQVKYKGSVKDGQMVIEILQAK